MKQRKAHRGHRRIAGMTLIELMVALAIGSFLMIGAVTVFMQGRTTFRITESTSRLQENARFALEFMEPDIRMASYFGLHTRSNRINGRASQLAPPAPPAVANDCGNNWTIDLATEVGGTNNGYGWACPPQGGPANPASDTLVIRRVSEDPVAGPLDANSIHVEAARVVNGQIFTGGVAPVLLEPSQSHTLVVNGYYVSQNSSLDTPGNPVPSLRMKTLGTGPAIRDQEVLAGVEDMQVQLGIDTDAPGTPNRGSINRYVNPGDPLLNNVANPNTEVLAVRLWLRIRAERLENGFTDTTNYVYADQNVAAPNDAFRRVLVSKTVYLRNARPPT